MQNIPSVSQSYLACDRAMPAERFQGDNEFDWDEFNKPLEPIYYNKGDFSWEAFFNAFKDIPPEALYN